jgi:FtsP/CotA-like multicopper oxidase with cupredoxin domain
MGGQVVLACHMHGGRREDMTKLRRRLFVLAVIAVLSIVAGCGSDSSPEAKSGEPLRFAPVYSSKNGALHLRVTAQTRASTIAGKPYKRMFVYKTELIDNKGRQKGGTTSAYIGAQWSVQPGDTLTIDYVNRLGPARFQPFADRKPGEAPPPPQEVPQPLNLHTHGLSVSPSGNSDNVLLSIPQGRSNRFVIKIPKTQDHGLYWYHPHIHGVTDEQVYNGLAGHIVVSRADGDFKQFDGLDVHPLMIRYNVREAGRKKGEKGELIDASAFDTKGTALDAPDVKGAKKRGAMIYTVNGQLRPKIKLRAKTASKPAASQVWAMTNVTGSATYVLALDEVAKADASKRHVVGDPVDFTIVSIDGTPLPKPKVLTGSAAKRGYLLGQGGRVAILVQGPSSPSKVVRLLQIQNRSGTGRASAYDSRGLQEGERAKAIGGWRDYTRDVLATTQHDARALTRHVDTPATLTTNYKHDPDDLPTGRVDNRRTFDFNGVAAPSKQSPNQFPVDGALFPSNRVAQPKAGTVEEWTIRNLSSLHHPFHVHTQSAKVMKIVAPKPSPNTTPPGEFTTVQSVTELTQKKPATWTQDVVNLPPAKVGADGMPIMKKGVVDQPGKIVLRLRFGFLGEYVEHCHRLPHEDRGMMSLVRTIPHDPVYAVTSGSGKQARVAVYRSSNDTVVADRIAPFVTAPAGAVPSTAIGDVDDDAIPDLAVASGASIRTAVKIYLGKDHYKRVSAVVHPFENKRTGASVALGDLNADGRDELVTGMGRGHVPRVAIFDGETRHRLADFNAYDANFAGGVSVATGMLEEGGRNSLVTGAGPGKLAHPKVNVYNFDLFGDAHGNFPDVRSKLKPKRVAQFDGAESRSTGVSVATGNPYAGSGGFSNILTTPLSGEAKVQIFTIQQEMGPANDSDVSASGTRPHDEHGHGSDVSDSGATRPHNYQPTTTRTAQRIDEVKLDMPADVATLSTPTGAQLLVVARKGGAVSLWESTRKILPKAHQHTTIKRTRTLEAQGRRVSGI